ncbi:hypothetical protein [Flavobacterium sp.]|uniref:hypothetical protein n=1 Tax=Flavobacterium sp. TaxID=239 RepID=UPI0040344790
MKLFVTLLTFLLLNFSSNEEVRDIYTVIKIYETDADPLYLIANEKDTELIVGTNDSLNVDDSFKKVAVGNTYLFVMKERKFRGETSGYRIHNENGDEEEIWNVKKDGEMPSIYIAENVTGQYIQIVTK